VRDRALTTGEKRTDYTELGVLSRVCFNKRLVLIDFNRCGKILLKNRKLISGRKKSI
jgi:hypothetical protein